MNDLIGVIDHSLFPNAIVVDLISIASATAATRARPQSVVQNIETVRAQPVQLTSSTSAPLATASSIPDVSLSSSVLLQHTFADSHRWSTKSLHWRRISLVDATNLQTVVSDFSVSLLEAGERAVAEHEQRLADSGDRVFQLLHKPIQRAKRAPVERFQLTAAPPKAISAAELEHKSGDAVPAAPTYDVTHITVY